MSKFESLSSPLFAAFKQDAISLRQIRGGKRDTKTYYPSNGLCDMATRTEHADGTPDFIDVIPTSCDSDTPTK